MSVSPRLEALAGAGVEKVLAWLSALVEIPSRGADDRTGLELTLVQAVVRPKVPIVLNPAAAPVVDAAPPRTSRSLPGSSPSRPTMAGRPQSPPPHEGTSDGVTATEVKPALAVRTVPRELDALQAHWDDVLTQVRGTGGASVQALLRSCKPVAVDDRQVVVAARFGFHRSRLEDAGTRRAVEEALAALIGEPVALKVVLVDKEPRKAKERPTGAGTPAGLPPELADDPLVQVAVQEMGAVARTL